MSKPDWQEVICIWCSRPATIPPAFPIPIHVACWKAACKAIKEAREQA